MVGKKQGNQRMLYVVSYLVPPDIIEALKEVEQYAKDKYPDVGVNVLEKVEITRFISEERNRKHIHSIIDDVASKVLPLSLPLSLDFDLHGLSVSDPHLSLGTSDKAGLKLLRLEELVLENVKPYIYIPERMPVGIHPKQQEYFEQYGQPDILRWHRGHYTVATFPSYQRARAVVSELAERFRPVDSGVEIAELFIELLPA